MLLRTTSAPILNSCFPQHCSKESSPELESQFQRRSLSIFSSKSIDGHTGELLHQALSDHNESNLKSRNNEENALISRRQRRSSLDETTYTKRILDPSSTFLVDRLLLSSGLGDKVSEDDSLETLVSGGGGKKGNSGGNICNGGGVGGSGVDGGGSEDAIDTYYKEIIDLNPGNSLLTGNYAKFLKEVRGDMKKAEEYYERAILGKTKDGNVVSQYANLILQNGDRERAHSYFQQAVKMSPQDCYVQASYASFLWDVEEDEEVEEEEEEEEEQKSSETEQMPTTTIYTAATLPS